MTKVTDSDSEVSVARSRGPRSAQRAGPHDQPQDSHCLGDRCPKYADWPCRSGDRI